HPRAANPAETVELHVEPAIQRRRLAQGGPAVLGDVDLGGARIFRAVLVRPFVDPHLHVPLSCSHAAASRAWYVTIRSAPARRIPASSSRTATRSSSQPFAAAAFTIEYSPLTL